MRHGVTAGFGASIDPLGMRTVDWALLSVAALEDRSRPKTAIRARPHHAQVATGVATLPGLHGKDQQQRACRGTHIAPVTNRCFVRRRAESLLHPKQCEAPLFGTVPFTVD